MSSQQSKQLIVKRSAVPGKVPSIADIGLSEIAFNTFDGKAYIKKNVDGVESIVELGTGSGGPGSGVMEYASFVGTAAQTLFTLPWNYDVAQRELLVFINGVKQASSTFTETSISSITLEAPGVDVGDSVEVLKIASLSIVSPTITLSGAVTGSGTSSIVATINPNLALTSASTSGSLTINGNSFGPPEALSFAATVIPTFNTSNNFALTLTGNCTLANPTGLVAGQSGAIVVTQDATGGRTLAFGSFWKFAGGTAPVLSSTANAVSTIVFYVESASRITTQVLSGVA